MTCRVAASLAPRHAVGLLEGPVVAELESHLLSCAACRRLVETELRLARAEAHPARAPEGFAGRVMAAVYREALKGGVQPAGTPEPAARARVYRRLGLSFVLSAVVLAGLLAAPTGLRSARPGSEPVRTALMAPASAAVRGVLADADAIVRDALRPGGGSNP